MTERLERLQAATSPSVPDGDTETAPSRMTPFALAIDLIDEDPEQPRRFPGAFSPENPGKGVTELADGIREHGLLQPILAHRRGERFRILVGERRWRAFRLLSLGEPDDPRWTSIPAIEWTGQITPATVLAMQIIENDHRERIDPVARREAFLRLQGYCGGNASRAMRMAGVGHTAWYRVVGQPDPGAAPSQPKAASRLSFGQITRALASMRDRLPNLSVEQASEMEGLLSDLLAQLRRHGGHGTRSGTQTSHDHGT